MSKSKEWNKLSKYNQDLIEKYQRETPMKLGALAKELNLVVKKSTLAPNISGEIKESDDIVTIRINRHDAISRQRYTLAHEIAHFFLHRSLLKNGIKDDVLYRSAQSNEVEAEANRLAADIIMPLELVKSLIKKYSVDDLDREKVYECVAEELAVSTTALAIRLEKI